MASKKLPAKPTMAQAFNAAQGAANGKAVKQTSAAKPKDKGIIGEAKDVLGAMGNQVKQDAQFVAAVGKGAAKGAGAIAKGAGKVAGKVANVTVGDIASAPLDVAKNVAKGAGKVAKFLSPLTLQDKNMYSPRALAAINKGKAERAAAKAAGSAAGKMAATVAGKAKDAKANKVRQATDAKYDKVSGTPKPKRSQMDPGMYKPRGGTPVRKDPGMYKPRGKAPSQSGGRPSKRGL